LKLITLLNGVNFSGDEKLFVGVLDNPNSGSVLEKPTITFSGWIIPCNKNSSYTLKVTGSTGFIETVKPNVPRPDVAKAKGVAAFAGDSEFYGFRVNVPALDEISVYVQIDGVEVLWKSIAIVKVDENAVSVVLDILRKGQVTNGQIKTIEAIKPRAITGIVGYITSSIEVIESPTTAQKLLLTVGELFWFDKFIKNLETADFLAQLLLSYSAESGIKIPAPFTSDLAELVSTAYIEDINFLIFRYGNTYFYIGQYLHTVEFVYFPEKSFLLRIKFSHYEQRHLIGLINHCLKSPETLLKKLETSSHKTLGGLILNGMSPYHFFYDCIPSLYAANKYDALKSVTAFFSIKGECYYPVEKLFNLKATNQQCTHIEFATLQSEADQFFIVAGASYKQLDALQVAEMDRQITCHAIASSPDEMTSVTNSLEGCYPVLWIGISAQKRSWINQNEALIKTLQSIYAMHPNMAIIFDGMTSNIFKANADAQDFSKDHELVDAIKAMLPSQITALSTVGLNSQEKMVLANAANFYIANYSTGSMYPARFAHLPGVAHLSKAMMATVRDIHIHYKTATVPDELITDIPDQNNKRLDFISYSIDEDAFSKYVCSVFGSTIEDKTKQIATEGNL